MSTKPSIFMFKGPYDVENVALKAALAAGVRRVRIVPQRRQLRVRMGEYNWRKLDDMLDPILKFGATPLIGLTDGADLSSVDQFLEYVEAIGKYTEQVSCVLEFWNEPSKTTGEVRAFLDTYRRAQDLLPRPLLGCAFPGRELLRPGSWSSQVLAGMPPNAPVSFHLIKGLQPSNAAVVAARAIVTLLGPAREKWLTEVGYSSYPKFQEPLYQGEHGQANWVRDVIPQLFEAGVDELFWALLEDESSSYGPHQAFGANGLFRADRFGRTPKPAWRAFQGLLT